MAEELSIIVDKNDKIIWYKPRSEINSEDIYRVSALWIENSKWEILLAQRGFMKSNGPWKWGTAVAGTVEKWETYEDNIYKEAQEEIGLNWVKFTLEEKLYSELAGRKFFVQYYYLKLDKDIKEFILEFPQVESVRWFKKEEIKNLYIRNPHVLASKSFIKRKLWL